MSRFPPNVFGATRFPTPGAAQSGELPSADWTIVTPGAFEVLGIALREGRLLTAGAGWLAGGIAVGRLASSLLFGTSPTPGCWRE